MKETWKPIPGYDGLYEVSDQGRVKSSTRTITYENAKGTTIRRFIPERMRKTPTSGNGYPMVSLWKNGKEEYFTVHELVLVAFVGPRPPGWYAACHNDGNRLNNHLSNLRWGTYSENSQDTLKHGNCVQANRTHCPRGHELKEPNLVPSIKKQGRRECLACSRTQSYTNYHRHKRDHFKKIADSYHEAIMKEMSR